MPSKIQVDQIAGATGSTVTLPSGQTLDLSSGTVTLPNSAVNLTTKVTGTLPVANGGTGLTSLGSASQVLKVNSGATALEFGTVSSKIGAVSAGYLKDTYSLASGATYLDIGLSATITPTASNSSILAIVSVCSGSQGGTSAGHHYALYRNVNSGGNTKIDYFTGNASGSRNRGLFSGSSESGSDWTQESSSATVLDNSTSGLSYTLGNSIVYKIFGYSSGTVAVVNKSYRDSDSNDDTRNISSIILIEVLA